MMQKALELHNNTEKNDEGNRLQLSMARFVKDICNIYTSNPPIWLQVESSGVDHIFCVELLREIVTNHSDMLRSVSIADKLEIDKQLPDFNAILKEKITASIYTTLNPGVSKYNPVLFIRTLVAGQQTATQFHDRLVSIGSDKGHSYS